ncbi:MAG: secreted protein [Candidatus Binatus sp.]|nr:secreted protein [Candidatus Binatus sp.]
MARDTHVIAFENEYVRIVNINLEPGQSPVPYTPGSDRSVSIDLATGRIRYSESALSDQPGDETIREIRVEIKSAPETNPSALDAVRVDPARYRVDFENDHVRVVRLGFGPHESGLMVSHPPRVLATLTDVSVKLLFLDGRTDARGAPAGVAAWLEAETLQTKNAGDQRLEVVLIEPKGPRGF